MFNKFVFIQDGFREFAKHNTYSLGSFGELQNVIRIKQDGKAIINGKLTDAQIEFFMPRIDAELLLDEILQLKIKEKEAKQIG